MPRRPCLAHGCPALITRGSYCRQHKPRNGSTRQWRNTREVVLARDGYLCLECGQPAQHVDHIVPVEKGGSDALSNLQSLCAKHNLQKGNRV